MRRSLLSELVDDLALDNEHHAALRAGRALLTRLREGIDDAEYEQRIDWVRKLVPSVVASGPTGSVDIPTLVGEPLSPRVHDS